MLPMEKKGNALQLRQDHYLQRKRDLIEHPEVQVKLTQMDLAIAEAGVQTPVRSVPDEELVRMVATATKFICRDVGIKDWNNAEVMKYDSVRFFSTLKKYYNDLTLQEVKMAFELAAVGELDEWLPKDRNGEADHNHYQAFSLEYYSKILKAFRARKNKTWHKARKALPAPEVVISEAEKEENRLAFLMDIYEAFDQYKEDQTPPRFILSIFIQEFINAGLIPELPKPSKETTQRAYRDLVNGNLPRNEKKTLVEDFHKNKVGDILRNSAQQIENNKAIAAAFEKLIKEKSDIREILK